MKLRYIETDTCHAPLPRYELQQQDEKGEWSTVPIVRPEALPAPEAEKDKKAKKP